MGFKFRRFRAKLNWKQKTTVPEVVCLRYHITSEFTENLPEILSIQTNGIEQGKLNVIKENKVPRIKDNTDRIRNETNTTSENRLQNLELNANKEKAQPKSILKKSENNSPDLENNTKIPLIFMTENHDDQKEQKSADLRSNLENVDGKIVNWRETIEIISLHEESQTDSKVDVSDKPRLSTESKSDSEDEDDDGVQVNTYGNGISYSTQAANIFFAPN